MSITKITTHNQDALNRLLYQYRDSEKLKGFITALYGTQVQELEDAAWQLLTRLNIDSSEGVQLDHIGKIVGQSRQSMADDRYRIWIKAKIAQNISEGDIEQIISIWRLFNSEATTVQLIENFPAEIAIYSDIALDPLYSEEILTLIQRAMGAGIRFGYTLIFDPDNAFGFLGSINAGGFGDTTDPEIGGKFSTLQE